MDHRLEQLKIPTSDFETMLIALNQDRLSNLSSWVFDRGMLFQGIEKWWKKGEIRPRPHEGLDICFFKDENGNLQSLNENTIIPAPYDGTVVCIKEDFIGTSLFVVTDIRSDRPLLWALGHMRVGSGISEGMRLKKSMPLGTLSPVLKRGFGLRSHLHISVGFLKTWEILKTIDWPKLSESTHIELLDPLPLLFKSFETIDT